MRITNLEEKLINVEIIKLLARGAEDLAVIVSRDSGSSLNNLSR